MCRFVATLGLGLLTASPALAGKGPEQLQKGPGQSTGPEIDVAFVLDTTSSLVDRGRSP